jgi:hypothetical protein
MRLAVVCSPAAFYFLFVCISMLYYFRLVICRTSYVEVSAHVRIVGLECAKLQPSIEDICITYFSDRKNIPQHGLYLCVTATRRGHLNKLTRFQAVEAMQSFFSMPSLKLVAIRQVGMRASRDR